MSDKDASFMLNQSLIEKGSNETQKNEAVGFTVVKRDGSLVPFRKERIYRAIELAFRDTKKIGKETSLPYDIEEGVSNLTEQVVRHLLMLASKGACLNVEGIQDLVEVTLMKSGYHDVARDYIIYRDQHKALRDDSARNLKFARKDGAIVRFNPMKVASKIETAFRGANKIEGQTPETLVESVNLITMQLIEKAKKQHKLDPILGALWVSEEIENLLMSSGFFKEAKYLIKLDTLKEEAAQDEIKAPAFKGKEYTITKSDGQRAQLTEDVIIRRIDTACRHLDETVDAKMLLEATITNFYEGIKEEEIDLALIMAARSQIEKEPAYSQVASRLLLDVLYREAIEASASDTDLKQKHAKGFLNYLKKAVHLERVHPALLDFDLEAIAQAMDLQRDDKFCYLGLQTLYDRYFIHDNGRKLETPQMFWMRVSMGLALNEKEEKTQKAIEFYNVLSNFLATSSTPTLFNSGTMHPQLSSCYLSTISDDLHNIFKVVADDAQLSKWAGGIGNDWTSVRATGSRIKGTNGQSQGVIPFLKVANDTAVAVNQCFSPETLIYTNKGIKPISEVKIKDLVLGSSGRYCEVTETFAYNQQGPMVALKLQHSLAPLSVTTEHPFYALSGIPEKQALKNTKTWLEKGKISPQWIDAKDLEIGDYVAQVIPKEVVVVPGLDEEDMRLYGLLLRDGHLSKDGTEWEISGKTQNDVQLNFVRQYLKARSIHSWETTLGDSDVQIHWASAHAAVRDGATGQYVSSGSSTLPFEYDDIYDEHQNKHIAPRLSHLPPKQTLALLQGLIENQTPISKSKELTFSNASLSLAEGLRYQALRLGIPTTGKKRKRLMNQTSHSSQKATSSLDHETVNYDIHIPVTQELAEKLGCQEAKKFNWFTYQGSVFTRVKDISSIKAHPFVYDLKVDKDESYMTSAGLAHNGGKRKGAMCAYLETWHLDIEDFLELRKNTGDERRRTHDMNTANWIPDLFMKRVATGGMWTLFSPSDCPDLHDLYGEAFEARYEEYEKMADQGKLKLHKRIEASLLWRKMLSMLFETGHPWMTFKDPSNIRSPQDHQGVVHSSNLCTEILLNTSVDETAVCNLASINLKEHMVNGALDEKKLQTTIKTTIRMLDNVIDINFYPIKEARNSNLRHRPIGLGLMGFQDCLYEMDISYASHEAIEFADRSMELISYFAISASCDLAKEKGTYESYKGSKWDRGFLPIDTLDLLEKERGGHLSVDRSSTLDWSTLREKIKNHGIRNCNTMAIAPTATISNITGVTQSIEPMYSHLFVKSNLSGEFTIPNTYLVEKLKQLDLWDADMLDDLKYFDGSIKEIERIPDDIKQIFLTAFEIDPEWVIECASRRQKWIDMGESLNLYLAEPSGKKLHQMYMLAWQKGLKTTYYLRTRAATQVEKSTTDVNRRGLQPRWMKNKSASGNVQVTRQDAPVVKACSLEEGCESCQ